MSWLIWTVLGIIAFTSQLAKGASTSLWLVGSLTSGGLCVLLLSVYFGSGGIKKSDMLALFFTIVGLSLWYATQNAALALIMGIAIGSASAILTAMKAYEQPNSEAQLTWLLASIAGLLALASIKPLTLILAAYPLYIFVTNLGILFSILLGQRQAAIKHG